jgi:hypothetical protein
MSVSYLTVDLHIEIDSIKVWFNTTMSVSYLTVDLHIEIDSINVWFNTTMSVSYLTVDLHIEIDSIKDWLTTIVYANRNDSNLPIVNFLCGNIPFPLAYNEVYISLC